MKLEPLFSRRLLVVSGKGGVGKTTVAAALASLAARSGRDVLLVSTDGRGDAPALFGKPPQGYEETELEPSLRGLITDFDSLLADYVRSSLPVAMIADRILASTVFRYFTRATPGLPDLMLLGKVRQILRRARRRRGLRHYDLVVLDAPATGHALSLVTIPRTLLRTIPAGPLRHVAQDLDKLLEDPEAAALVVVAEPAELAAREAEEVVEGASAGAGLTTGLLVINRVGRGALPAVEPHLAISCLHVPELDAEDEAQFFEVFRERLLAEARPGRRPAREKPSLPPDSLDTSQWLRSARTLVLTGPGGVGKTTLSAAAGIAAASLGKRVLVLTVDPARRLAQALGIEGSADRPVDVALPELPRTGRLRAMQIEPKATFERLLTRVAPPETLERIRQNRFYSGFVDALPGVLEYMGVEALAEYARDPEIDLIVLDTPPAARGLEFLAAPDRMVDLLENDALRWFLRSDSLLSRALSGASRGAAAILKMADHALGFGFLGDLADFFRAFDGLYEGFKERSQMTSAELRKARFWVISSLDRSALRTAGETAEALALKGVALGLVLNRVPSVARTPILPPSLTSLPLRSVGESDKPAAELPEELADRLLSGR